MDLLASRYPQYAEKIKDNSRSEDYSSSPPHPRDQRRRATIVTYNPNLNQSVEFVENGTMSDVETSSAGSLQRGQYLRSSLPIIRSSSSTFERPLGLVFLVYKDETKKAALPNEITTLDTVRALFVRSFADKLSMEFMESPRNKIYIVDPRTNIYYQLEDLRDIKDRTVLKIHECDSDQPQVIKPLQEIRGKTIVSSVSSPSNTIPLNVHIPSSSSHPKTMTKSKSLPPQNSVAYQQMVNDSQTFRVGDRPQSTTPGMDVMRGQSGIVPRHAANLRFSPERQTTPDRSPLLGTIPENGQLSHGRPSHNGYSAEVYPAATYNPGYWPADPSYSHQMFHRLSPYTQLGQLSQMPSSGNDQQSYVHYTAGPINQPHTQPPYMSKNTRSHPMAPQQRPPPTHINPIDTRESCKMVPPNWPSSYPSMPAVAPNLPPSIESAPVSKLQRSQSYRANPEREAVVERIRSMTPQPPQDPETKVRMERMEAQLANLTAWVHNTVIPPRSQHPSGRTNSMHSNCSTVSDSTCTGSTTSSLSDIPSAAQGGYSSTSTAPHSQKPPSKYANQPPVIGPNTRIRMILVKRRVEELKTDLKNLQLLHRKNAEAGKMLMAESTKKILNVLSRVSFTVSLHPIRKDRHDADANYTDFVREEKRIDQELCKLEDSVEEVRTDVISKQCRVNSTDVEKMALTLSQLSKAIAELKAQFPQLQERMKKIMYEEMDIIMQEEKFLKDQPERLESALRRCKKLTGTLFTLKRLVSVQHKQCLNPAPLSPKSPVQTMNPSQLPVNPQKAANSDNSHLIQNQRTNSPGQQQTKKSSSNVADTSDGSNNMYSLTHSDDKITAKSGECTSLPSSSSGKKIDNETEDTQITLNSANKFRSSSQASSNLLQKNSGQPDKTSMLSLISKPVSTNKENISRNSTEISKESSSDLSSKIHSARSDFFSSIMEPSKGSKVINKTSSYSPVSRMDYTVYFSSPKSSSTIADSVNKPSTKPIMSTATAVAELRSNDPPTVSQKPVHLWKVRPSSHHFDGRKSSVGLGTPSSSVINSPSFNSNSSPALTANNNNNNKSDLQSSEGKLLSKKSPPPPPPRKSSKTGSVNCGTPPQVVHYTITQHCNVSPNNTPTFTTNASVQNNSEPLRHSVRDNSPSRDSACSSESSTSCDSQQTVITVSRPSLQKTNSFSRMNKPSPPQRTSSQLSYLPDSRRSNCWEQPVVNGVKGLSADAKRNLQETTID
ncbi:sickle tail protein-like [Argonauta hians]